LGWLAVGLLQWFATVDGIVLWLGLPWLLAAILSAFLAWFPLVGSVIGAFGAVHAWGWSWTSAALLFGFPLMVAALLVAVIALSERR
jgi:hypothetical protein